MEETFIDGEPVPKAELHALMQRRDQPALTRFVLQWWADLARRPFKEVL